MINPNLKQVVLERMKFTTARILREELINPDNINFDICEHIANDLVFTLNAEFLSQRNAKKVEAKYPADWKEAVKKRFAPNWFLKKYPMKYKHVELTASVVYPLVQLPKERNHIILNKVEWLGEDADGVTKRDKTGKSNCI